MLPILILLVAVVAAILLVTLLVLAPWRQDEEAERSAADSVVAELTEEDIAWRIGAVDRPSAYAEAAAAQSAAVAAAALAAGEPAPESSALDPEPAALELPPLPEAVAVAAGWKLPADKPAVDKPAVAAPPPADRTPRLRDRPRLWRSAAVLFIACLAVVALVIAVPGWLGVASRTSEPRQVADVSAAPTTAPNTVVPTKVVTPVPRRSPSPAPTPCPTP